MTTTSPSVPLKEPSVTSTPHLGNAAATRTRIKMCGLTREEDVDAAVAAGADALGFNLYPKSPRYISLSRAVELARRLPPFVTPVLLFVNEETTKIRASLASIAEAVAQFHGDELPTDCWQACSQGQHPYLRAARIPMGEAGRDFDLLKFAQDYSQAQAILLDAHIDGFGGGGQTFNWSLLPPNVNAHLVLSGGLDSANVGDGIAALRSRGKTLAVDVSSGVEALDDQGKPQKGIKDPHRIRAFVAAVRAADDAFLNAPGA